MALGLGEMLGLALADAEGLGLTKALGLGEGSSDGWALGLAEGTTGRDGVALTEQFELLGTGLGVGARGGGRIGGQYRKTPDWFEAWDGRLTGYWYQPG